MDQPNPLLLYQDEPTYGLLLKLIFVLAPASLLVASLVFWSSGETSGGLALLVEAFVVGLILWVVCPRKYQVYRDRLQLVLGGPLSLKIRFDNIKTIEVTARLSFSMNFATRLTGNHVLIVKKRGMSVAITPTASDVFVQQANRALGEWAKRPAAARSLSEI